MVTADRFSRLVTVDPLARLLTATVPPFLDGGGGLAPASRYLTRRQAPIVPSCQKRARLGKVYRRWFSREPLDERYVEGVVTRAIAGAK
jgi:hypothetical protein